MWLTRITTGWLMAARQLLRSRIALVLLFLIPTFFYGVVVLTTSEKEIAFQLASISEDTFVQVSRRRESLVMIGLAAVGFLSAFLSLNLIQKQREAHRRLVLCGYRPWELIVSKLALLMAVIVVLAWYGAASLLVFFQPNRFPLVALGFALVGFTYGCYGLLAGAIFRRELEGILCIVLLVNIDAGWLQNPVYYADAQSKAVIRALPAYFPSQTSMVAAFTDHAVGRPVVGALLYGGAFLLAALAIFRWRMRIRR